MATARDQSPSTEARVVSADGTEIAFEQSGSGPAVVLVASALADRSDTARLAALLARHFTVINYDRRGRGPAVTLLPTPPTARSKTSPRWSNTSAAQRHCSARPPERSSPCARPLPG